MELFRDYPLQNETTFKIGGKAAYFCAPACLEELQSALEKADETDTDLYILGGGSNILFSGSGVQKFIISTKNLTEVRVENTFVTVQSGLAVKALNKVLINHNLSGLEFSGGLPGSIGGAVYMNARCYGSEFSSVVEWVRVVNTRTGSLETLHKDRLKYSYKHSIFMEHPEYCIYEIGLSLQKGRGETIQNEYQKNRDDRAAKGQYAYPSAGCIFKNNYSIGISSGKLIDSLGLKGKAFGDAEIYEKHANFIVNKRNAGFEDVVRLIEYIEKELLEQKNIRLEREIQIVK